MKIKWHVMLVFAAGLLRLAAAGRQPQPYTLVVKAYTGVNGHDFRIRLTRSATSVVAHYARLDSVQLHQLRKDQELAALTEMVMAVMSDSCLPKAAKAAIGQRYVARADTYRVYRQDSLQLSAAAFPAFVQLLDSVTQASTEQLEQREANRFRIVLDGTNVSLLIKPAEGPARTLSAHSPRARTHPLLYRLLHESLQLYRQRRPTSLLPTSYTSNY